MLELARACDRAEVNRIARQVHQMHVSWRPDIYRAEEELFSEERFAELIGGRAMFVAKLDGVVIGFALAQCRSQAGAGLVSRKIMLLDQLCVDEPLRGHGIGTRMMAELRALARAFGCTDLQLNVYPQNDGAVAFYQKCGFRIKTIQMDSSL